MTPSPQQEAIIAHLRDPRSGSLIVEARAGTGKTSTILEAAIQSKDPTILLCAFNRRIADELITRLAQCTLPRGRMIKAQTLHSIGLQIVRQGEGSVTLDRDATDQLVREVVPSAAFPIRRAIVRTVRYLKETCWKVDDPARLVELIGVWGFADQLEFLAAQEVAIGVLDVMAASRTPRPVLDFCDMIWRPHALDLYPRGRYRTVIVDEAQDMTLGQFFLIERMLAPGGRLVVVGDLRQEIYDWRGAAGPAIWNLLRGERYTAQTCKLTWSFRCPVNVVNEARVIVPDIEAAPDADLGIVDTLPLTVALQAIAVGDFFLARTNAGAVTSAIRAQLHGAAVRVLGGYEELDPLLDLLKRLDATSLGTFTSTLTTWANTELGKSNITEAQAARIEDRSKLLADAAKLVAPRLLPATLKQVFRASDAPAAIFSTVHKAKGLEASRVFLLRKTFARHQRGHDGERRKLGDIPIEELNIEYVAITRAIDHLTWVIDDVDDDEETL